jgi:hypothetical protein
MDHLIRLHADDRLTDDLRGDFSNVEVGQSVVSVSHAITKMYGAGSEPDRAATFLRLYQRLVRCIDLGEFDLAMYDAARFGQWVEAELEAPARMIDAAVRARQESSAEWKTRIVLKATEIRNTVPSARGLTKTALARLIRTHLLKDAECEGEPAADVPSVRTIRRVLGKFE